MEIAEEAIELIELLGQGRDHELATGFGEDDREAFARFDDPFQINDLCRGHAHTSYDERRAYHGGHRHAHILADLRRSAIESQGKRELTDAIRKLESHPMPTKNEALDEVLPELPLLDGDDEELAADDLDHELSTFGEDDPDPFDDAAAEDLFDEADGIDFDAEGDADADDEREVDIGEITIDEIDEADAKSADADDWEMGEDELDLDDALASSEDDGGEEGTLDASEELLDEALPELDADEGDELAEGLLLDEGSSLSFDDERLPGWADVAWETKPLSLSVDAMGELLSLSISEGACAAVTARGELIVSRDGGESFAAGEVWRPDVAARGDDLAQVALSEGGAMYLLTGAGRLFVRHTVDGKLVRAAKEGLLAMAAARAGTVAAVSAEPARGLELVVSEDSGASWVARELVGPAIVVAAAPNPILAVVDSAVAMGSEAGLVVSRDGVDFELIPGCSGTVAVAFAGEASDSPLVAAVYREAEDRTYLVRVSGEGLAEVVADLGPTDAANDEELDSLGRANSLAWDAARKVLWVTGAFGVVAVAA